MKHGEPNHICRICGKPYFACDTCDKKIGKTWRTVACTAEHYDVYFALWKYSNGMLAEDEIKRILEEAEANKWKDSPSYDLIIELIGEPEEEEEEATPVVVDDFAQNALDAGYTVVDGETDETRYPVTSGYIAVEKDVKSEQPESVTTEARTENNTEPKRYASNNYKHYGSNRHKKRH